MSTPSEPIIYRRPLTLSNSVELYWYPPTDDGGNVITSYILECANISYINVLPSNDRKSIVRNLITGDSYTFSIKATNVNGNGNISSFNFTIPGFKPDFPLNTDFKTHITDYSNIFFSFNDPLYIGNSEITYNTFTLNPVDVTGNIMAKSPFILTHSAIGSNIIDPLYLERLNTNYDYRTYLQSENRVNCSDRNYFSTPINPNLPTNGLKLWLDPYDLTTINLSNSKVTRWIDKSKNQSNATVNTESQGPTYDSGNALINFNGSQYLSLPNGTIPSSNTAYSIFTYVSTSNIARNNQWFLYSGTPTANLSLGGFINSNTIVNSWWTNQQTSNSSISSNISYFVELTVDSGIRRTFINGTLVAQDSVITRDSTTANNIIGTNSDLTGNLVGSIGDIIVYDRILTSLERTSVRNYLERKKYNISLKNVGNVVTWLDASDQNNLFDSAMYKKVSYNNYVANWLDRSYANNSATQSNISVLPIRRPYMQNNNDVLEFNDSYLNIPTSSYPLDAFIVLKLANIDGDTGVLGVSPNANNYSSLSYDRPAGNVWYIGSSGNIIPAPVQETSANFLLLEWSIADNNNYIRRYGANLAIDSARTWTLPTNSNIIIGNANGFDFSSKFKGYIGEILMFNRQLEDGYRYTIEGYLSWKWGLQNELASDHPYKNSAPYLFSKYINNTQVSSFMPTSITGLQVWLDASDSSTVILSGGSVTQWRDKSSNNFHFSTTNGTPTYTNNSIILPNSAILSSISNYSLTTNSYIFIVSRLTSNDGTIRMLVTFTNIQPFGTMGDYSIRYFQNILVNSGEGNEFANAYYVNGSVPASSSSSTYSQNHMISGKSQQSGSTGITLSAPNIFNRSFIGNIYEVLFYSSQPTQSNREKIEGYLAWKWGFQSELPSNHPYKNSAPTTLLNSTPFVPTDVTGLNVWLDASDPSGTGIVPANNSTITTIIDKSYNSRNAIAGVGATLQTNSLNSKSTLYFNGTKYYDLTYSNFGTSYTVFAIYQTTINTGDYQRLLHGTSSQDGFMLFGAGPGGPIATFVGTSGSWNDTNANSPSVTTLNTYVLLSVTNNGTTLTPYANGTAQNTKNGTTQTFSNFIVGKGPGGQNLNGNMAELLIFNSVLSSTNREKVEGYLAWKWGLLANLPSNHPYKNNAP